jgi:hypothetical protein
MLDTAYKPLKDCLECLTLLIAYITGEGFPAVLLSWVSQVQVQCWILPHRDKP